MAVQVLYTHKSPTAGTNGIICPDSVTYDVVNFGRNSHFKAKIIIFNIYFRMFKNKWFLYHFCQAIFKRKLSFSIYISGCSKTNGFYITFVRIVCHFLRFCFCIPSLSSASLHFSDSSNYSQHFTPFINTLEVILSGYTQFSGQL